MAFVAARVLSASTAGGSGAFAGRALYRRGATTRILAPPRACYRSGPSRVGSWGSDVEIVLECP